MGVRAHGAILSNPRITAEIGVITDRHMPGDRGIVGQNHVVSDDAVMRHVHVGHEQAVAANHGSPLILHRPTVDIHAFTKGVVISDHKLRWLTTIALIRRVFANDGEREHAIAATEPRGSLEHDVGCDPTAVTEFYPGTDKRPRPHLDIDAEARIGIDDGARIDHSADARSMHMISALHASSPSTEA